MRLLSSIAAVAAVAAATCSAMAKDCQYCSTGPNAPVASMTDSYQTDVDPGKNAKLSLTVTIPGKSQSISGPFPVIFYFNGFQVGHRPLSLCSVTAWTCFEGAWGMTYAVVLMWELDVGTLWLLQGLC